MAFTVLYVCTGNVCRSPSAERLFRKHAGDPSAFAVSSAGTDALVGAGIDDSSASALRRLGVDPAGHRAHQFEPVMAVRADLVLTAEVEHRDQVMAEAPSAFRRIFTMREFARLANRAGYGEPAEVVARAARMRGLHPPKHPADDEIPDCFRADLPFAITVTALVADTVRTTVDALSAARPRVARRPTPGARPVPQAVPTRRRPRPPGNG